MSFFLQIYNTLFYQPIFKTLIFLSQNLPGKDFGLAIIILTLLIRLGLWPLSKKSIESQKNLQALAPKIKELQKKFSNNREEQARAILRLYREAKINPFSSLWPVLIQLPFLIALYHVFWQGLKNLEITPFFLGVIHLGEPNWVLALLAGLCQFWQSKTLPQPSSLPTAKKPLDFLTIFQKQMVYLFPFFTFLILLNFPSAIALYWLTTTFFSIFQQSLLLRTKK